MKKIPLTQGKVALVDDEDFEELSKYKWHAHKQCGGTFYAGRNQKLANGKYRYIHMHKEIMNTPDDMHTDHINHNGLDNRRENLRVCTSSQNMMNRLKHSNNTSGFKGVSFHSRDKKWQAGIRLNTKRIHLGYFTDKLSAIMAYREACVQYHKEFKHY